MTATVLATSQLQDVGEWTRIFPKQVTENYTSSVTFMKQLTVVAVSTITYLKNVFPEDSYTVETFGGLKLRILKKKCRDEFAQFVSTALMQAFEAFDKKYLHQLALCFYEDECKAENLVEYHIFEYSYHSEGVTMNVHSKTRNSSKTLKCTFDDVKERTIHMIRACVVIMQSCQQEMPPSYDISLRLYYNEEAPEDYQAPGFVRSEEVIDHLAPSISDAVKLGWVDTPYHKILARSYIRDSLVSSRDVIASQNPPVMTQNETPNLSGSSRRYGSESMEGGISCPCNKYNPDEPEDPTELITCFYCKTQQHASCFGVLKDSIGSLERHCCTECSDADPSRVPTDQRLASLSHKQRECLCIFRRTLQWCWQEREVSAAMLESKGIPPSGARRLLKLLRNHQVLPPADGDSAEPQKVNVVELQAVRGKFFAHAEAAGLVERLVAETFSSQESRPDPLADVLGPMEQISLQKAASIGRIVEPENQSNIEDATLKQYREAVFSKIRDEEMSIPTTKEEKGKGKRKLDEPKLNVRAGIRTKKARMAK